MQELGIHDLASSIKTWSAVKKSGNIASYDEGSDSSYLPDTEEGGQGDQATDLEDESLSLALNELSVQTRSKKAVAKKLKPRDKMPPGGGMPTKRVRPDAPAEVAIRVSTRSQTQKTLVQCEAIEQGNVPPPSENNSGDRPPGSPLVDWSYPDDAHPDDPITHGEEQPSQQNVPTDLAPRETRQRRPRPATRGVMLEKMTKAMGRRLPISIAEGNKRPHQPVQAAKFASESGVLVRTEVPILPHWTKYKDDEDYYLKKFMGRLSTRLAIDANDRPTKKACTSVLQSGIRQARYRLKRTFFNGIPANEVRKTSPVSSMTDDQWCALVDKWSNAKNKATAEQDKRNRGKVRYHQATGSRCYVATLHTYKEKNKSKGVELSEEHEHAERSEEHEHAEESEELDAVEIFKATHTSSKGISESAKEAISTMETLKAKAAADGQPPMPSVEVVCKALSQNSSSSSFLKNVGMATSSTQQEPSTEKALRQELAAEKESKAALQNQVDELNKKVEISEQGLAKTQREFEEFKKTQEENNLLVKRILLLNSAGLSQS